MQLTVRMLGNVDYRDSFAAMRRFTEARTADTPDEIWFLEHPPVFTQGQAGKAEHVLQAGAIPVIQADRGGQVTYHGPGQIVAYLLIDLRRQGLGVRDLVEKIEQAIVATLASFEITAYANPDAHGVYLDINGQPHKIASLGLRIRKGCSYHGLALNHAMDLEPFTRINPCGYAGLPMTDIARQGVTLDVTAVRQRLLDALTERLHTGQIVHTTTLPA